MSNKYPTLHDIQTHINTEHAHLTCSRTQDTLTFTYNITAFPASFPATHYPAFTRNDLQLFEITADDGTPQYQIQNERTGKRIPKNDPGIFFKSLDTILDQIHYEVDSELYDQLLSDTTGFKNIIRLRDTFNSAYEMLKTITERQHSPETALHRATNHKLSDDFTLEFLHSNQQSVVDAGWHHQTIACPTCNECTTFVTPNPTHSHDYLYCPLCRTQTIPETNTLPETQLTPPRSRSAREYKK